MKKHELSVLAAGTLWGSTGFFRRSLDSLGLDTISVIFIRSLVSLVCFTIAIAVADRKAFKIRMKDFWCFIGTGLVSFLLFTICYFRAMQIMSLSTAAILLYSAPCFVILISVPCFQEKITAVKMAALVMAFAGCCCVSGIGSGENRLSALGILFGLGSGICYALYSIFSRCALNRGYSSMTINFYTTLLASAGALVLGGYSAFPVITGSATAVFVSISTGIVTCFLPYLLYTYGLTGLENGKASIIASIEPVVATVFGVVVYKESLTFLSTLGIALVLGAIIILNMKKKPEEEK